MISGKDGLVGEKEKNTFAWQRQVTKNCHANRKKIGGRHSNTLKSHFAVAKSFNYWSSINFTIFIAIVVCMLSCYLHSVLCFSALFFFIFFSCFGFVSISVCSFLLTDNCISTMNTFLWWLKTSSSLSIFSCVFVFFSLSLVITSFELFPIQYSLRCKDAKFARCHCVPHIKALMATTFALKMLIFSWVQFIYTTKNAHQWTKMSDNWKTSSKHFLHQIVVYLVLFICSKWQINTHTHAQNCVHLVFHQQKQV